MAVSLCRRCNRRRPVVPPAVTVRRTARVIGWLGLNFFTTDYTATGLVLASRIRAQSSSVS